MGMNEIPEIVLERRLQQAANHHTNLNYFEDNLIEN
jgi:hypothetical protein